MKFGFFGFFWINEVNLLLWHGPMHNYGENISSIAINFGRSVLMCSGFQKKHSCNKSFAVKRSLQASSKWIYITSEMKYTSTHEKQYHGSIFNQALQIAVTQNPRSSCQYIHYRLHSSCALPTYTRRKRVRWSICSAFASYIVWFRIKPHTMCLCLCPFVCFSPAIYLHANWATHNARSLLHHTPIASQIVPCSL